MNVLKKIGTAILVILFSLVGSFAILVIASQSVKADTILATSPGIHNDVVSDSKESFCLALNIYYEARNQQVVGMIGVAEVTMNRVRSESFSNSVCEVVYKPYAFSWTANRALVGVTPELVSVIDQAAWAEAIIVSNLYVVTHHTDITSGAQYYHTTSISPYWSRCFDKTATINDHVFYADNGQPRPC